MDIAINIIGFIGFVSFFYFLIRGVSVAYFYFDRNRDKYDNKSFHVFMNYTMKDEAKLNNCPSEIKESIKMFRLCVASGLITLVIVGAFGPVSKIVNFLIDYAVGQVKG